MRLLLAEDDFQLQEMLKQDLSAAGYAVDVASDGVEAQYLGLENIYDLIILDLGLPGKNGIEILKHWRLKKVATPVIILTARDEWHQRIEGFEAGADDYVGKPFNTRELILRLKAVLHRVNKVNSNLITVDQFVLDEDRQSVTLLPEKQIELTGTEFKILRVFFLNANRIVSKAALAEHIYDFEAENESNVLEAYIMRLRRKLGKKALETRRGQGYIFTGKQT